jgi:signal transduction histidine kinase
MRLAPRLVLAFSALSVITTAGLGYVIRRDRHEAETQRFDAQVRRACTSVAIEVERQAERDQKLVAGACQDGEIVDHVAVTLQRGDLEGERLRFAQLVPHKREAFDLDELMLVVEGGDIVGADPKSLLATPRREVDAMLSVDPRKHFARNKGRVAVVSRCARPGTKRVGLVGVRYVDPVLERLGKTLDVRVTPPDAAGPGAAPASPSASTPAAPSASGAGFPFLGLGRPADELARAECKLDVGLPIVVTRPKTELYDNLRQIDQAVLLAGLTSLGAALLLGLVLARSLGRPLAILAEEASKVAADQAQPLRVRGSGEIRDLALAFEKMLEDLAVTRRRLAATSRVAAWREVARRVAHEVKNPLAPIRAAVETLRRLRAREDPAFDEYFDEATRTVLDEVHRISNIVTEFTRFARLPPPRPQDVDVEEVVKHVLSANRAAAGATRLDHSVRRAPPSVRVDRDQLVQVLTNLVQNALDAVKDAPSAHVQVVVDHDGQGHVALSVTDNGPGIAPEIAQRLFEPYATTKAHGTGLGLAIAQRIAIEHNGELSYMGQNGARGAVFRLVLPVEGPPPASEGAPTSG